MFHIELHQVGRTFLKRGTDQVDGVFQAQVQLARVGLQVQVEVEAVAVELNESRRRVTGGFPVLQKSGRGNDADLQRPGFRCQHHLIFFNIYQEGRILVRVHPRAHEKVFRQRQNEALAVAIGEESRRDAVIAPHIFGEGHAPVQKFQFELSQCVHVINGPAVSRECRQTRRRT